jgi:hypothetical protein
MEQFAPEQVEVLIKLIEAFLGGKRLNELPNIGNVNPLDLTVEVLDSTGESKQAKLAALLPYLEEQCAYGIEWDTAISSPLCTRIGNLSLHRSLPIQSRMKGVLLDDNGLVNEYLSPNNWLAHDRSGARGQVMVEIPAHWRKFETDGTKRRAMISEYPLPGYHFVKKQYISSYEASWERSTGKLCSVVNMGENYRGGNNNAGWDGTYRSLLGRPVTSKSLTELRPAARLRGAGAQWNLLVYNTHKAVVWMYFIEYANFNSQAAFNAQPDANGYKQGGLGPGVTSVSITLWNGFNYYYPFIPCGHTDSLGNRTGVVDFAMPEECGAALTVQVPRYRGLENLFGHIWKWADGCKCRISATVDNGSTGLSEFFVCDDPSKFQDSSYNDYGKRGNLPRNPGYIKELIIGEFGENMPEVATGASSTTYFLDYFHTDIPNSGEAMRGCVFGGLSHYFTDAGIACTGTHRVPSFKIENLGTRLCFIPEQ